MLRLTTNKYIFHLISIFYFIFLSINKNVLIVLVNDNNPDTEVFKAFIK